jgi:hypothetical protein
MGEEEHSSRGSYVGYMKIRRFEFARKLHCGSKLKYVAINFLVFDS